MLRNVIGTWVILRFRISVLKSKIFSYQFRMPPFFVNLSSLISVEVHINVELGPFFIYADEKRWRWGNFLKRELRVCRLNY